jgi:hypothetical protein
MYKIRKLFRIKATWWEEGYDTWFIKNIWKI